MTDFADIFASFNITGIYRSCESYGSGHVHDTYLLEATVKGVIRRYILQRLNTNYFRKPEAMQDNLRRILEYLKREREEHPGDGIIDPELVQSKEGSNFLKDRFGNYWRCLKFIEDSYILERVENAGLAYEGARIFGLFSARLINYNARRLHITIPDFMNMEVRLRQLMIAQLANPAGRFKHASGEFKKILDNQLISRDFTRIRHALPDRVTHNDTRISNVLFSNETGKGISVISLDTMMTGTLLTDFGDMVRTFTTERGENEKDLGSIRCNPELFEGVLNGFMASLDGFILDVERANLLLGAKVMIYMQAVRFLTDYLNGDVYYKTTYPVQNLDRAKNQMKLLESFLEQEVRLREIMKKKS